jgi:hypothetical protein
MTYAYMKKKKFNIFSSRKNRDTGKIQTVRVLTYPPGSNSNMADFNLLLTNNNHYSYLYPIANGMKNKYLKYKMKYLKLKEYNLIKN